MAWLGVSSVSASCTQLLPDESNMWVTVCSTSMVMKIIRGGAGCKTIIWNDLNVPDVDAVAVRMENVLKGINLPCWRESEVTGWAAAWDDSPLLAEVQNFRLIRGRATGEFVCKYGTRRLPRFDLYYQFDTSLQAAETEIQAGRAASYFCNSLLAFIWTSETLASLMSELLNAP